MYLGERGVTIGRTRVVSDGGILSGSSLAYTTSHNDRWKARRHGVWSGWKGWEWVRDPRPEADGDKMSDVEITGKREVGGER